MTLPAWREDRPQQSSKPRRRAKLRDAEDLAGLRDRSSSPANQLLAMVEAAAERGGLHRQAAKPAADERAPKTRKRLASLLLGWSCAIMAASVGYLAYETLKPAEMVAAELLPGLDFSGVTSRYVQSSEGPAVELSGVVRNIGEEMVEPEVTIQLAGTRVAVEEQLRLGTASLPPGAERPFTVRALLPEGTRTVRLLSPKEPSVPALDMPMVSPGWTAGGGF
ncbi:hypothetical protein [Parvularcula maris]|uniref:DUF3426 domain-containing protein n=1 Tax=Parvularcula maris TaxID=2965077 RepID=A0A9X2L7I4_9PROT|nr:hypothetical protein [Parvularcula maris]MCQ8184536.1 hypothetical protein [Parvularcula maris]